MSKITRKELEKLVAKEVPSLTEVRHDLHAHPQIMFQETYASGLVQKELTRLGIPFEAGVAKTGVVAWIVPDGKKSPRAAIALRADMDALPITEENALPYASQNPGFMHACGHDGHTTMLLGAARVLAQLRSTLPRPVKLIFQPAEEVGAGGAQVVEAGALDKRIGGLQADRAFALHGSPEMELGTLGVIPGPTMAAADFFTITLTGRGGHGARPSAAIDPVVAGAHLIMALQTVVSRNVDPLAMGVLSICNIHAGQAQNVIPEKVTLGGTVRCFEPDVGQKIRARLQEITENTAKAFGCRCEVDMRSVYPVMVNEPQFTEHVRTACRAMLGDDVVVATQPRTGSEDFAYYGQKVPACYAFLGLSAKGQPLPGLHHPKFNFNDKALAMGIRALCGVALAS
jgi:hippurate hydrolase